MIGPGKYDHACTLAREATNAEVAIVIILSGDKGSGFSIQGDARTKLMSGTVADLLEDIAATIRRDLGPDKDMLHT